MQSGAQAQSVHSCQRHKIDTDGFIVALHWHLKKIVSCVEYQASLVLQPEGCFLRSPLVCNVREDVARSSKAVSSLCTSADRLERLSACRPSLVLTGQSEGTSRSVTFVEVRSFIWLLVIALFFFELRCLEPPFFTGSTLTVEILAESPDRSDELGAKHLNRWNVGSAFNTLPLTHCRIVIKSCLHAIMVFWPMMNELTTKLWMMSITGTNRKAKRGGLATGGQWLTSSEQLVIAH